MAENKKNIALPPDDFVYLCESFIYLLEQKVQLKIDSLDNEKNITEIDIKAVYEHIGSCKECKKRIGAFVSRLDVPIYLKPIINNFLG